MEQSPLTERLDLSTELELVRHATSQAVLTYSEVVEDEKASKDALLVAGQLMVVAIQDVTKMVEVMARVEEVKTRVVGSAATLIQSCIHSIVRAASDVFQDDARVREFEQRIRENLEAVQTSQGVIGTDITPDQDVLSMDDTVPVA